MKKGSSLITKAAKRTSEENRIALLNILNDITKEKRELEKKTKELKREKTRVEKSKNEIEILNKKIEERRIATLNILQDIEEAREELKKSFEELKVLDKLKDEFVNIGAHELKTPLVPIIGYLDMMLKNNRSRLSKKERKELDICLESAKRLNNLITDVSDVSKLETKAMKFEMMPLRIGQVIGVVVNSLNLYAESKNIKLTTNIQPELPLIKGDELRLTQALSKLVENAIKFTDEGSVTVSAKKERNNIMVSVKDTGMGIRKKDMSRLFTKFFQAQDITTRKTKGTGLGLIVCKSIIEAHKGRVWAESKGLGKGTTFSFTLPVKD